METTSFYWIWKIEPIARLTWYGTKVFRYAAVVQGIPRTSNAVAVRFETSVHKTADKAHEEIIKIISRTENEVDCYK